MVKLTPEVLIAGGNGNASSVEGLIAMQLMNQLSVGSSQAKS
jgi:hypothetical protein